MSPVSWIKGAEASRAISLPWSVFLQAQVWHSLHCTVLGYLLMLHVENKVLSCYV